MPDQKITDLADGGAPQAADEFVVARAAANNKLDWASLEAAAAETAAEDYANTFLLMGG